MYCTCSNSLNPTFSLRNSLNYVWVHVLSVLDSEDPISDRTVLLLCHLFRRQTATKRECTLTAWPKLPSVLYLTFTTSYLFVAVCLLTIVSVHLQRGCLRSCTSGLPHPCISHPHFVRMLSTSILFFFYILHVPLFPALSTTMKIRYGPSPFGYMPGYCSWWSPFFAWWFPFSREIWMGELNYKHWRQSARRSICENKPISKLNQSTKPICQAQYLSVKRTVRVILLLRLQKALSEAIQIGWGRVKIAKNNTIEMRWVPTAKHSTLLNTMGITSKTDKMCMPMLFCKTKRDALLLFFAKRSISTLPNEQF